MPNINFNSKKLKNTLLNNDLNNESQKEAKRFWPNTNIIILFILLLQLFQVYLLLNPINLFNQLDSVQIINNISKKTSVPAGELPIIGMIGDNKVLPDVNTLKQQNSINAQVYADAQNGDYVLGYSSKLIIYRKNEDKIIYDGLSPISLASNNQNIFISNIIAKAKEQNLISKDSNITPTITIVSDVTTLQNIDKEFYREVQKDDAVAIFSQANIILIYRPSTSAIINSGKVQTTISK